MSIDEYAWKRYAELQGIIQGITRINDYAFGLECGLNYLVGGIKAGILPNDPQELDATVKRKIESGARLHRSRSMAQKKWMVPPKAQSISAAAEARFRLAKVRHSLKPADDRILMDVAQGFTDREIADRHASTAGAIRVRICRLRLKLRDPQPMFAAPAAVCRRTLFS